MEYLATFGYKKLVVNAGKYSNTGAYGYAHGLVMVILLLQSPTLAQPELEQAGFFIPNWSSWTHGPNVGQFLITWINVYLHWYYDPIFVATTNRFTSLHPPFSGWSMVNIRKFLWLVVDLPLWKMMDFVSWDGEIPNWMEK